MTKKRKSYKQKYNELKLKLEKDKNIKEHTKDYVLISKPSILSLLGLVVSGLLCWGWFVVLQSLWLKLDISIMKAIEPIQVYAYQLEIIPHLLFGYILGSLFIISLVALIKGGYDKLKDYDAEGLIFGLISGLIWGLIGGLIWGLTLGLIFGLMGGLIWGLILGSIVGLIIEFEEVQD